MLRLRRLSTKTFVCLFRPREVIAAYVLAESKDIQIQEHLRKAEVLEEATLDLESTILQFRELVLQLQT